MPVQAPEATMEANFPVAGLSLLNGYGDQQPVQMPNGVWGRTTRQGVNVRGYDASGQRKRGGGRPGLSKYLASPPVSGWLIQGLDKVVTVGGGAVQQSQSGRQVYLVAVSQGNVYYCPAGGTSWTQAPLGPGVGTPPLIFTGQVMSASLNQQVWFADGSNWVVFDPSGPTVGQWAATAGSLPVDPQNNTPRLICAWRGRIVLAGFLLAPSDLWMSKVGNPRDFDLTGASSTIQVPGLGANSNVNPVVPGIAFYSGSTTSPGQVGDTITALAPYSDDVLIMGCDHSLYAFNGDPTAGGQIDRISDSIGMAWGNAWCKDPSGVLYFFSNRTGVYALEPGSKPARISQQVEQLVNAVDTGANTIQMVWNDRWQGFHLFITPTAVPASATTHLFWEQRTGAWWQDSFANLNHNPTAVCAFDGNTLTDRVVLLGGSDGYVRAIDPTATTDDGTAISSSVLIGPFTTVDLDDMTLKDVSAVLGETSGPVSYAVYVGNTAEKALSLPAVSSGTWGPSRNLNTLVRRAGHAVYISISSTNAWSLEQIRARVSTRGKVRARGA